MVQGKVSFYSQADLQFHKSEEFSQIYRKKTQGIIFVDNMPLFKCCFHLNSQWENVHE